MKSDYSGLWKIVNKTTIKPIYMKENTKKVKKALAKSKENKQSESYRLFKLIVEQTEFIAQFSDVFTKYLDGKFTVNNAMLKNIQDRLEAMQPKKTFWADFGLGVAVGTAITILLYATKII